MARKRIEMSETVLDEIRSLMARGGTVESITAALRAGSYPAAAPATVSRRMAEMRKAVNADRASRRDAPPPASPAPAAPAPEPDLPQRPEDIPEGAGIEDYDRWIARAEKMADDADIDGDLKAIANAGRLVGFFMSEKRKAAPKPKEDPNAAPDMVALGAQVEERFLKMIDMVLEEMPP